ncbi:MAG: sodium/proline symporter PutP [Clostridiales bacterium]|nr:sodium/proline symporter PutP [Clostridiales bacterium]
MTSQSIIQGMVLLLYLIAMIMVGFVFYKKSSTHSDYVLGGRSMNVWVTSMSAQASDMSGWLLMGLPGLAYLLGAGATEAAWTAIGLALGTYLNWLLVAKPLRKYTQAANNSLTIPDFLQNRFKSKSNGLRVFSALFILIFFVVYTSSMFAAGANLFDYIFGIGYHPALILSVVVVAVYTFLGGFKAVCWTDLFQGLLMFLTLVVVPVAMYRGLLQIDMNTLNTAGTALEVAGSKFSLKSLGFTLAPTQSFGIMGIVGAIAWGLGYFGQPHILARFMAIKSPKEVRPARIIAMVWVIISLAMAVIVGMVALPYIMKLYASGQITDPTSLAILNANGVLEGANTQKVFMVLVQNMFPTVIAGIMLAAVLAAIMSTADSQLLVASSSFSSDIYHTLFDKNASDKKLVNVSRLAIVIISVIACLLAIDPESSVFEIVAHAWAGFGAAFGPIILCSLFWRNCNGKGALAGVIGGGAVALLWAYIPSMIWGADVPGLFSLYEIVPGFIVSLILIFAVSKATGGASDEVKAEFDRVKASPDE